MAVQDHLSPEGWVSRHLDGDVAPVGVHYVERVVVDEGLLLGQVDQNPALGPAHVPGGVVADARATRIMNTRVPTE